MLWENKILTEVQCGTLLCGAEEEGAEEGSSSAVTFPYLEQVIISMP